MKKTYPVGATWKATNKLGYTLVIWLDEIREFFEIWKWKFFYPDGSYATGDSDWNTSYQACYKASSYKLFIPGEKMPRFKRVR